jgi:predicted lipoprotein
MKHLSALTLSFGLAAAPAHSGVDDALEQHILPGLERFAEATEKFAKAAENDCRAGALRAPFQDTFDAWMPVADLRIGPSETGALSVGFWPDPRGFTQRALIGLITDKDPVAQDPDAYADVSVAARGLFALDMLLYDPGFSDYTAQSYTCDLVTTIAVDLGRQAEALHSAWKSEFALILRNAGADGNTTYLTETEAKRAIFTQILSSLEFTSGKRLGLPMGDFDRPRPALAEARRSGRSLRNVLLAVEGTYDLAVALAEHDLPQTDTAYAQVKTAADHVKDRSFGDVETPQGRLRVEVLQQAVETLHETIASELGAPMGIAPGFNAQDGD